MHFQRANGKHLFQEVEAKARTSSQRKIIKIASGYVCASVEESWRGDAAMGVFLCMCVYNFN
jgi:hypothetical protein